MKIAATTVTRIRIQDRKRLRLYAAKNNIPSTVRVLTLALDALESASKSKGAK